MPELPEVETIVRGLNKKVLKRTFLDVWTDNPKMIKRPKSFSDFRNQIRGKKIIKVWRRAKNIIFGLSGGLSLLIHQKLTGHLLIGKWQLTGDKWLPKEKGSLEEPVNRFIHLIFRLDDGRQLALSDLRKFAKAELWNTEDLMKSEEFKNLGPEPLDKNFSFEKFKEVLRGKTPRRAQGKIKQVLMDQSVISGIGNIYSDEILWRAKIHPLKGILGLKEKELKKIYQATREILEKAIQLRGTSISDYRDIEGKEGLYEKVRNVYQREGEKCSRCGAIIKRLKIGGRSAHYCPVCQKL